MTRKEIVKLLEAMKENKRSLWQHYEKQGDAVNAENYWREYYGLDLAYSVLTDNKFANDMKEIFMEEEVAI